MHTYELNQLSLELIKQAVTLKTDPINPDKRAVKEIYKELTEILGVGIIKD